MPNHVTSYVRIKGTKAKINKLVKDTKLIRDTDVSPDDNNFDLNGIIQMPSELKDTVSPTTVVPTQKEADKKNAEYRKGLGNRLNIEEKVKYISEEEAVRRSRKYATRGTVYEKLTEKSAVYGILNWYDWASAYWGTKWGCYRAQYLGGTDTEIAIKFESAWSTPYPIFARLEKDGFEVVCVWQDEDPSNQGEYGDPYEAFDINYPAIEVDYLVPENAKAV